MRRIIIIVLSFILLTNFAFKSEPKTFYYDWGFLDSQLSKDTIALFTPDTKTSDIHILQFKADGKIKHYVLRPTPRCGNGMFALSSSSTWTRVKNSNEIIITLKGGYLADSEFEIKGQYKLDSSKDKELTLIKTKSFYNKKTSYFKNKTSDN